MPPVIDEDLCTRCGVCYDICPQDCFSFTRGEYPSVPYPRECWHCGACVIDCPPDAIHLDLPLQMHIVPSPALYGPPGEEERENLMKAAAFSRSITKREQ